MEIECTYCGRPGVAWNGGEVTFNLKTKGVVDIYVVIGCDTHARLVYDLPGASAITEEEKLVIGQLLQMKHDLAEEAI